MQVTVCSDCGKQLHSGMDNCTCSDINEKVKDIIPILINCLDRFHQVYPSFPRYIPKKKYLNYFKCYASEITQLFEAERKKQDGIILSLNENINAYKLEAEQRIDELNKHKGVISSLTSKLKSAEEEVKRMKGEVK